MPLKWRNNPVYSLYKPVYALYEPFITELLPSFALNNSNDTLLISIDALLEERMRIIDEEKVLLDFELAELLLVSTKDLIRKVRNNPDRFPPDFLIKIPADKFRQSLPESEKRRKKLFAFTLAGIMMAAGRFNTARANQLSIRMVEIICGELGVMEEILKLIQAQK